MLIEVGTQFLHFKVLRDREDFLNICEVQNICERCKLIKD